MSYTSGVGSSQQSLDTTQPAAAGTSKTARGSLADATVAMNAIGPNAIAGDRASVSATGILLAQALSGSDVRVDKVAALQQQIAAGTYNVPASAVADKLMGLLLN